MLVSGTVLFSVSLFRRNGAKFKSIELISEQLLIDF